MANWKWVRDNRDSSPHKIERYFLIHPDFENQALALICRDGDGTYYAEFIDPDVDENEDAGDGFPTFAAARNIVEVELKLDGFADKIDDDISDLMASIQAAS